MGKRKHIDIRFDGPPSHESGRFIEVEDETGASINAGEWIQDGDMWLLRIKPSVFKAPTITPERVREVADRLYWIHGPSIRDFRDALLEEMGEL